MLAFVSRHRFLTLLCGWRYVPAYSHIHEIREMSTGPPCITLSLTCILCSVFFTDHRLAPTKWLSHTRNSVSAFV